MKFDESIASAAQVRADVRAAFQFTLEQGPFAGRPFTATLSVCPNPCCPCASIGFECQSRPAPDASAAGASAHLAPVSFDLDVFERAVNSQVKSSPEALALARDVVAELSASGWKALADFFLSAKRRQMETMDLDAVRAQFPSDVMAGDGSMVGYVEIFPWSEPFEFTQSGGRWVADDQYCCRPGCDCSETALAFFRMTGAAVPPLRPLQCDAFLRLNYVSGNIEGVKAKSGSPAAGELMQALRASHPGLEQTLRNRHRKLQHLGKRLLPKTRRRSKRPFSYLMDVGADADEPIEVPPPTAPATRTPKVGRNDPCPCGSGKKYKKCCGARV